ncbi:hypothetical protein [Paenibacillus filicis]
MLLKQEGLGVSNDKNGVQLLVRSPSDSFTASGNMRLMLVIFGT